MIIVLIFFVISIIIGIGMTAISIRLRDKAQIRFAQEEAAELLENAKGLAADAMADAKERVEDYEDQLKQQNHKEISQLEARVEQQEASYRKKRSEADRGYNVEQKEIQKQQASLNERSKKVEAREQQYREKKDKYQGVRKQLIQELQRIANLNPEEIKAELTAAKENELQIDAKKKAHFYEEETKAQAETIAKHILNTVFNRFPRQSSLERGVGTVEAENEEQKNRLLGKDGINLTTLAQLCELEINFGENNVVQVVGFDPVRRELATRTLEKIVKEQRPNPDTIKKLFEKTKAEVFKKIEGDGKRIAQELGMQDLHPEIKNMLGSLRYRYSFAQNQFHHVGEVGWLCGLIAAELGGVEVRSARRSGLLHDVGKAMDHAIEGGHAVIGADFIKARGEKDHIVHAVRAHHYEEQPATDLAFLVIAADAISGARPGARRSTVTSYNQKIEALSTIADGFNGVLRTMIFNAGREVRVVVDSRKVNDVQSLKLCRDIADKIEAECSYPGQIKVMVVRETHAEAHAK